MVKLYHTQGPIWWNTGNEVKPNSTALNKFQWKECENFNITWIDETHIRVIVPTNHTTTMIKIEDDTTTTPVKYFYLAEVLNRTTANHECIYELDIWLTYLKGAINDIRSIRTLDANTLSDNINIEPVGVPTGNIIQQSVSFEPTIERGLNRDATTAITNIPDQIPHPGITTNIYYVFKAKDPTTKGPIKYWTGMKYLNKIPNYVLVPLLNIQGYGFIKEYEVQYYTQGSTRLKADVLNSYNNIQALVNHNSDFGAQGLGEFIGIWIGPNYFRIKEKGIQVLQYNFGAAWNRGVGDNSYPHALTEDILVDYGSDIFYVINQQQNRKGTFLALRVDSIPLSMTPLKNNLDKTLFLKGLRYQENQDNHLICAADSIAFNQGFNYTNGVETTTVNINVPIAYDGYYDMLNQQKHTLNTSLALSGVNSIVQGVGALTGLIPPTPTTLTSSETITKDHQPAAQKVGTLKTRITEKGKRGGMNHMGWKITNDFKMPPVQKLSQTRNFSRTIEGATGLREMSGAANGLISAGMQFASTLANQEAYRADLRTKMSAAVLNANDKYVSWYKIATKIAPINHNNVGGINTQQFIALLSYEILSGPETEPGISYTFYGVPSQPQIISGWETGDAYIQIDENTSLKLQNDWGSFYTPIIKEAMLTLLINGIRISGGKIK